MDRGRPLAMSTVRDDLERCDDFSLLDDEWWRDEEDEWCLELLECLEEEWEDEDDLDLGTSRMLSSRPVVGSLVEASLGLCDTW